MGLLSFLSGFFSKPQGPNPWANLGVPDEPLFRAISQEDPSFQSAYNRAAATIPLFMEHIRKWGETSCSVKLRFRDPIASERLGEDRFVFLWLSDVHHHAAANHFSAMFFEVPPAFQKWHQVGQRLTFEAEEIFDWMVLLEGHLHGGYTLRVTRERLSESERESYDRDIGVSVYEPVDT